MCFETEFGLLQNEELEIRKSSRNIATPSFRFNCGGCEVLAQPEVRPGGNVGDGDANPLVAAAALLERPECRFLNKRLDDVLPHERRGLSVQFKVNTVDSHVCHARIDSLDIFVTGDILKELHSIMGCGPEERLGLKLKGELTAIISEPNPYMSPTLGRLVVMVTRGYVDLVPRAIDDHFDHRKYELIDWKLDFLFQESVNFGILTSWKLSQLTVIVEQKGCSCARVVSSHATQVTKNLLVGRLGADVEILTKDDVTIPCHGIILISQSPVIEKMLTKGHFVEGSSRQIKMSEWSLDEVNAFLAFLYYGGVDTAVEDAFLNVTLLRMADYYQIQSLKDKMGEIWLKRSIQLIPVDAALRMVGVVDLIKDSSELIRKAMNALALHSDEEIMESELFQETFPCSAGRTLFLFSRVRF